jgi:hypothetical protein
MTPPEFAAKWAGSQRAERAAAQEHFIDLCRLIGVPTPNEADPTGAWYAFEEGAGKAAGGDGFAGSAVHCGRVLPRLARGVEVGGRGKPPAVGVPQEAVVAQMVVAVASQDVQGRPPGAGAGPLGRVAFQYARNWLEDVA